MVMGDFFPRLNKAVKTIPDLRAIHYWDKKKLIGKWFKDNVTTQYEGDILWDATILFGPEATWDDTPKPMVHYGRTILHKAEELKSNIKQNIIE